MTDGEIRTTENAVRDVKNWLAVFKTEYDIADEAMKVLHEKLDALGEKVGSADTEPQAASDALAATKQWLAVFASEYNIVEEAVKKLHENLDKVGDSLANVR